MSNHTLSVLVSDQPGVLARVASLFSRRGFNIESLAVGPTERDDLSRITLVTEVDDVTILEQLVKQLNKLIEVIKVVELEPGAVGREDLLQSVWGYDFIGETRTLDMHIGTLRSKLGDDSSAPRFIKTVRGVGYRFLCDVVKEG